MAMGLDVQSLRVILTAKRLGAELGRTVTLGRQDLLLTPAHIEAVCGKFGIAVSVDEAKRLALGRDRFCEPMLERLGARSVDSIDASSFEGASIIHDLNKPMPADIRERYDLVFDGGTLEHVFDFPSAIRGALSLPRVGGHYVMASPANNQMGHGFYQFSPDLFYRVFSPDNGYEMRALFLAPTFSEGTWFAVKDPAVIRSRVGYNTSPQEMSIFAIARRTKVVPLFQTPPQQSDYHAEWTNIGEAKARDSSRLAFFDAAMASKQPPGPLKSAIRGAAPKLWQLWQAIKLARRMQRAPDPSQFEPFPMP